MERVPVTIVPVDEFQALLALPDLVFRIQQASRSMDEHRRAIGRLAAIRGAALLELRQGQSVIAIADQLGVTRQQVYRLLREALGDQYDQENPGGAA